MIELAFHQTFYSLAGLKAAIEVFADFGEFDWSPDPDGDYFRLKVTPADDVDAAEFEGEFMNFVLARSVETPAAE